MKKQYGTPDAEKLEFDYKDAVVASSICWYQDDDNDCPWTSDDNNEPEGVRP